MITVGTGIGCAVMADGNLISGSTGAFGEIGHSIISPDGRLHPGTGVRGSVESYASATALIAQANTVYYFITDDTSKQQVFQTAKEVFEFPPNPVVLGEINNVSRSLGMLLVNVSRYYDPSYIVLGGGLILADNDQDKLGYSFFENIVTSFQNEISVRCRQGVSCHRGQDACYLSLRHV